MRRVLLITFCAGVASATLWAQERGRPEGRGEGQPGGPPGRGAFAERMFERVVEELGLDEEQRAQFEEIAARYRERMRERQQRFRELRQAERDGDEQRAAQLRAEVGDWRGPGSGMNELLEEIEPILREEQLPKLWEIRDRMERRQLDGERQRAITRELPDELGLDEAQRQEFERLLRESRERARGRWTELRPLWEELRQAEEAGDTQRADQLRRQIEDARSGEQDMFAGFFEQLSQILTEEQRQKLAAFRERLEGGGPGAKAGPTDVRNVLRAVRRLELTDEQREQVRDIEREAISQYRKIGRRNQAEQAGLAAAVKREIAALLTAEQKEQFERAIQQLERRSRPDRQP